MEKNKAIQLLERLQDPEPYEPMLTKDAYDAIQMAIDALSADGDTISRKAAIDVIDSFNVFESRCDQIKLEQMIGELPPVQPERIKGRWIAMEKKNLFRCSECGAVIYSESEYDRNEFHKFCGRCGAEMGQKGENNESN